MLTKKFWIATGERAVKTFAQALIAAGLVGATGLLDVDWVGAGSTAGLAAVVSVLTSVASSGVGEDGPSVVGETLVKDAPPKPQGYGQGI